MNDPPSFNISETIAVSEYSTGEPEGLQNLSFAGFAVNTSRGSPTGNEDEQGLTFTTVLSGGDGAIFGDSVRVSAVGGLTFSVGAFVSGNATFAVTLQDSGGTAGGGGRLLR